MRTLLLIALATALAVGRAHAAPAGYADARAAWLKCFPTDAPVEFPDDLGFETIGYSVKVTRNGPHVRISAEWGGSGHEAVYGGTEIDLDANSCAALWERHFTWDGAFVLQVRVGWTKRGAPTERELTALVAAPAHADQPAFAMARAWLDHDCDGGPDSTLARQPGKLLAGPIAPAQPWFHGQPAKSPPSFWSEADEHSIAARASLHVPDDADDNNIMKPGPEDQLAGVIVPGLAAPRTTFTVGAVEIREAVIGGRNEGRAIALYDRATKRHRWVLVTRGCVQGTTVKWLGAIGTRAIGLTASRDPRYARGDAIVVIDTAAGTAWAVALPEPFAKSIDSSANGWFERPTATLAGTTVTFGAGLATLDLSPALAELPPP